MWQLYHLANAMTIDIYQNWNPLNGNTFTVASNRNKNFQALRRHLFGLNGNRSFTSTRVCNKIKIYELMIYIILIMSLCDVSRLQPLACLCRVDQWPSVRLWPRGQCHRGHPGHWLRVAWQQVCSSCRRRAGGQRSDGDILARCVCSRRRLYSLLGAFASMAAGIPAFEYMYNITAWKIDSNNHLLV